MGRFQTIATDKRKQDHTNKILESGLKRIKVVSLVNLLGVRNR